MLFTHRQLLQCTPTFPGLVKAADDFSASYQMLLLALYKAPRQGMAMSFLQSVLHPFLPAKNAPPLAAGMFAWPMERVLRVWQ